MNPKVSIIIPSYSNHAGLRECLTSIVKYTDLSSVEIITVLNGAIEESRELYREFPVKVIWFPEAIGYTRAANEGLRAAQGEFACLLNDDCVFLPQIKNGWLDLLLGPFTDPKMAITGPVMQRCPDADREFLIFFCVLIRKAMLDQVGLLDEIFNPGYGEDTDLCCRAVDSGWKIQQVPDSKPALVDKGCEDLPEWKRDKMWSNPFPLYHDGNQTFGKNPEHYDQVLRRNAKILKAKYNPHGAPRTHCDCGCPIVEGVCVDCERRVHDVELWRASVIDGWFGLDEGAWIAKQAKKLPVGAKVLEVGSWHGRSSRFIADNLPEGGQLWCVDTWIGSSGEPEMHGSAHYDRGDHAHQWWWCNLQEHMLAGRVIPVRMHSDNAAHTLAYLKMEFDMIFIDGDHGEEGIKTDVEAWTPLLKEGGLLCGHDYYKENEGPFWVHVRQCVESRFPNVEKAATSIWYTRPEKVKSAVYDCFPLNDELDLLEVQLNELDAVVDRWVISEAVLTHSGQPKPLYFKESLQHEPDRWAKWAGRITHIIVEDFPNLAGLSGPDLHWSIERYQRDCLMRGLEQCKDTDIVLISDADEIPRAAAVASYNGKGLACLSMKLYYGSMNCEGLEPWLWTRILTYGKLKTMTPCQVRYNWESNTPNYDSVIENAGWHFSFMGGPDGWVKKLEDTPHQEYNQPEFKDKAVLRERVLSGRDMLGRDIPFKLVEVDDTFPKFVTDNLRRFEDNQFIMHAEANDFIAQVKRELPQYFTGKRVLEVGSLDINGSVRGYFEDCQYTGIDLAEGRGVDVVSQAHEFVQAHAYDVVISSEMLEHDEYWIDSLNAMYNNLRPGGLMVLTCAGPQRPEHGTARTNDAYSSPFTADSNYYRNISVEDFSGVLPMDLWSDAELGYGRGGEDLYFRGVKRATVTAMDRYTSYREEFLGHMKEMVGTATGYVPPVAHGWHPTVTACVSTKDRYQVLPLCLSAIINQTTPPQKLKVYDDGEQKFLPDLSPFNSLLRLTNDRGIEWEVITTPRQGQVVNHQHCLDNAKTDWVWRVDDDEIPEPDCLERLLNTVRDYGARAGDGTDQVGAIAGLVHHLGPPTPLPAGVDGSLNDVAAGLNIQWFDWNSGPKEVQHLYSTFLYRVEAARKAGGYPRTLSRIGHREETIFSHAIHRAGYKLLVTPHAKTIHLQEATGGIRSFTDGSMWERDERVFQTYLQEWGAVQPDTKLLILDIGLGDHLIAKGVFTELKRRYPHRKWTMAVCYPNVFEDEDVTLISIADAKGMLGERYDEFSLYKWMWERNWEQPLADAMMEFWGR